jgi:hypothetical protein
VQPGEGIRRLVLSKNDADVGAVADDDVADATPWIGVVGTTDSLALE